MKKFSSVGLASPVTIPITWPSRFRSGPPELPGLTAASNWTSPVSCWLDPRHAEGAIETGDDPGAHRAVEPERVADDERFVADAHRVQIPQRRRDQLRRGARGAQDSDVVLRLLDHNLGGRLRAVGEGQLDLDGVGDDVQAGEDVAPVGDEHAAP